VLLEPGQEDLADFLAENKVRWPFAIVVCDLSTKILWISIFSSYLRAIIKYAQASSFNHTTLLCSAYHPRLKQVRVVASLPCYGEKNVDQQRGAGVFDRSIRALQLLNEKGYGKEGTGMELDLVYNPGGPFLAPPQGKLEQAYKSELGTAYGIVFSRLFCLNNMPIKRYVDFLQRRGKLDEYMEVLVKNFNPAAAEGVMCRDLVSVGWDGRIYDCDFNQQLDLPILSAGANNSSIAASSSGSGSGSGEGSSSGSGGRALTVFDLSEGGLAALTGRRLRLDNHCYGCTAGSGSSCTGATS
jgi:uncharacterized membrane protein YgcG